MRGKWWVPLLLLVVIAAGWAIGRYTAPSPSAGGSAATEQQELNGGTSTAAPGSEVSPAPSPSGAPGGNEVRQADTEPDSIGVIVNKQYGLEEGYKPEDLVYPNVPFIFKEKIEKRMLRKEAAAALEEMFAGAEKDGVYLAGVSGYRSEATQTVLFDNYVKRDGEEKARTYSAVPGHSEHQTGLAIDLSGRDGKCAAESCFAGTKEADWLAQHAPEYGFIIRYPEGKEAITGYMYEAWHVRYVGKELARTLTEKGLTLEEYYNAVPVSK
ncbi:peptidase M15 [Paenibacillus stellifer]|uniref:Peptidase M15 n=1 Tax=Paenibacillus stellifer TaxID=169760 RepID=A0A089LYK5_9BACL|nr:M15 family metallopeptidase [Paenibacillus stellifer]AIQ65967.1 peptidase M15 [Paenibacillus stellifer]